MPKTSSPGTNPHRQPADYLKTIIVTFLTPMFLWSCDGDLDLARLAATETLDEFGILRHRGLIAAAKIIACDLAALMRQIDVRESSFIGLQLQVCVEPFDRFAVR